MVSQCKAIKQKLFFATTLKKNAYRMYSSNLKCIFAYSSILHLPWSLQICSLGTKDATCIHTQMYVCVYTNKCRATNQPFNQYRDQLPSTEEAFCLAFLPSMTLPFTTCLHGPRGQDEPPVTSAYMLRQPGVGRRTNWLLLGPEGMSLSFIKADIIKNLHIEFFEFTHSEVRSGRPCSSRAS